MGNPRSAATTAGIKPFKGGVIPGLFFALPANNASFKVTGTAEVVEDCTGYSIMPHMHLIGRSIKVTLKAPAGEAKNPNNPNHPPRPATFGEQTTNEMCFVFLGATSDRARRPIMPSGFGRGRGRPRAERPVPEGKNEARPAGKQ